MNMSYRPVGVLNFSGVIQCEVFVVFEGEDKQLYCGFIDEKERNFTYVEFLPLASFEHDKIKYLNDINYNMNEINESYSIGDSVITAFQINENDYFIGTVNSYVVFLNQLKSNLDLTNDKSLISEIEEDLEYYDSKKLVMKK